MEIFLNPNVAYLVLVIGFLVTILAMVSPGTGFLEVIGLGLLVLAGYQVSQLTFSWIALIILVLGVFPFILFLRKTKKWYHFAISLVAMILGSTFLFVEGNWRPAVHPAIAIVVNLLMVGFFWIILRKGWDALAAKPENRLHGALGSIGETRSRVYQEGTVYLNGELWSATSGKPIAENKKVKVISRNGYILEVEELTTTRQ